MKKRLEFNKKIKFSSTHKKGAISFIFGLCFIVFGITGMLALLSYNPADPSFNNFTSNPPSNILGIYGAHLADSFMQIFAGSSFFIFICVFIWGLQDLFSSNINNYASKTLFLLISSLALQTLLINFSTPDEYPFATYSGVIGHGLYVILLNLHLPFLFYLQIAIFIISTFFALGFAPDFWKNLFLSIFVAAKIFSKYLWISVSFIPKKLFSFFKSTNANKEQDSFDHIHDIKIMPDFAKTVNEPFFDFGFSNEDSKEEATVNEPQINESPKIIEKPHNKPIEKDQKYHLPTATLLNPLRANVKNEFNRNSLEEKAIELMKVLRDFGINGSVIGVSPGPVITLFEMEPAAGTKSSRVIGLADDIARTMRASSARISVMPGKNSLGIELPNPTRETVFLRELIESAEYKSSSMNLPIILGKDISGAAVITDLSSMPHLLVAGTTGSGKSVAINTMILSLLYKLTPDQCQLIMIDPKMLELSVYDGIPHLLAPVVTEANKAITALKWVVREMENRYRLMSSVNVRNISGFNEKIAEAKKSGRILSRNVQTGFDPETGRPIYEEVEIESKPLPYIVVIVDEMADLMIVAGKEIEASIQRLAQMARAAGIHIIMATQRPSVDVITGVIKANFPTRISFHVTSKIDSRTILGEMGAEQLLGKGDMLFMSGGSKIKRIHGPFVADSEVETVVNFLKNQKKTTYEVDITSEETSSGAMINAAFGNGFDSQGDELYKQAVELVIREKKASTSFLQRCFKIGYNKAASLMEQMEKDGIVGPANHVGKRQILIDKE